MDDNIILHTPPKYKQIVQKSAEIGFTMPSDIYIGTLLKTLIASKPKASVLELGTGVGLSLSWMIDGLDQDGTIISVDNDAKLIALVSQYFKDDKRVSLICEDGAKWIEDNKERSFDLVFADAWPGKYSQLDEVLAMIKVGGLYVIDDMTPQPNWPEGHEDNVKELIEILENRDDFTFTKMNWSTGVILGTRVK